MSTEKRILIIVSIVFGTPLVTFIISTVVGSVPNDGFGLYKMFALSIGIASAILSLIIGVITSFLLRNKNSYTSLLGYIIPAVLGILYVIAIGILN
jgi:hypothetical protein